MTLPPEPGCPAKPSVGEGREPRGGSGVPVHTGAVEGAYSCKQLLIACLCAFQDETMLHRGMCVSECAQAPCMCARVHGEVGVGNFNTRARVCV